MASALNRHFRQPSSVGCPLGNITLAGYIENGPGIPAGTLRTYGSYALVYCLGDGDYEDSNGFRTRLRAGDLILVFPDLPHRYGPGKGDTWTEIYVVFEGPVFDLWRERGVLVPQKPVHHLQPVKYWRRRIEEIAAPDIPVLERVCRLQSVLAEALSQADSKNPNETWGRQARELLGADLERPLYVEEVARRMKTSPETFRKKFARLTGLSPWQYRQACLVERACQLIHQERLTNKEIAGRLGFSDEFHFSKCFKKLTGRSPKQYRALVPRSGLV